MTDHADQLLRDLRETIQNACITADGSFADDVAAAFSALDEHLFDGGTLPRDWNQAKPTPR